MLLRPRFFSLRPRRQSTRSISLRRRRRRSRRGPGFAHSAANSLSWLLFSLSPIWGRRVFWRAPTQFTTTTVAPHVALACTAIACVRTTSSTTPRETSGDSSDEEADEDASDAAGSRLRRKVAPTAKSQPSDTPATPPSPRPLAPQARAFMVEKGLDAWETQDTTVILECCSEASERRLH